MLVAVAVSMVVIWDVSPSSLVDIYHCLSSLILKQW
jgi:hypothetical protein